MEGHFDSLARRVHGRDLICIQDTSDYMYTHHKGILKEGTLGRIGDDYTLGVRVHPMLVMDAADEFVYGFSSFEIINRNSPSENRREEYKKLNIEDKESYRWIQAALNTKRLLKEAQSLTIVGDRESDVYQIWSRIPDDRTHLVIRTSLTRVFVNGRGEKINAVDPKKRVGYLKLTVPVNFRKERKSREAHIEVFVQQAWTRRPPSLKNRGNDGEEVPVYVVVAKEITNGSKEVSDPIEWKLLTDIKVSTLGDAMAIISTYKSRWTIEQIFRLTKQKGFQLESSQLETGHAIENLIALVFIAAIRVFQMVKNRDDEHRSAEDLFDESEVKLLTKISKGLEGKSEKSKNKKKPATIAFVAWIIARLGNWKPEDRDPPGPITMLKGWIIFQNYLKVNQILSG
jgi:Transposase DDE domain